MPTYKNAKDVIKSMEKLEKVITESKRGFADISTSIIYNFFEKENIDPSIWKNLYQDLSNRFNAIRKENLIKRSAVEVNQTSVNTTIKERQPRKAVLGEIKRI